MGHESARKAFSSASARLFSNSYTNQEEGYDQPHNQGAPNKAYFLSPSPCNPGQTPARYDGELAIGRLHMNEQLWTPVSQLGRKIRGSGAMDSNKIRSPNPKSKLTKVY